MDTLRTDQASADVPNAEKAVNEIRPKTAVLTNITKGADFYMRKYLDINSKDYGNNKLYDFNQVEKL